MIFPRVHYAFAEFRGGAGSAPSKYAPGILFESDSTILVLLIKLIKYVDR